jgi:transposase
MTELPALSQLTHDEKDTLIRALWAQVQALTAQVQTLAARVVELEAKLGGPPKTPDNSSLPPSQGKKPNRAERGPRRGPRPGSLGRMGGGRPLAETPDEIVSAKPVRCAHCQAAFDEADHVLHGRYDKIDLPPVVPVVTRVERYAGRCRCCGGTTLAPVPEGLEPGTPFSVGIVALAMYLRFVHAISYRRLSRLLLELFGLAISEGALDAAFLRGKTRFDAEVAAILTRLRCARVVCSDETSVRIDGRTCWNWVFQNSEVVIHVIRRSRGAGVVAEVLDGHRPALWVSDLYGAQQGHAEEWQICLAHQLRDCAYATDAGDAVFAPRMKALLLRAVVLARRHRTLAPSTRREYRRRLECALDAVMALAPTHRDGQRLRKRYGKLRSHLFTFLDHPELPADNNGSERELRPTATYRKVTGGFRSAWGADLFAGVRSVIGTAARRGVGAYQAIQQTLRGQDALYPG